MSGRERVKPNASSEALLPVPACEVTEGTEPGNNGDHVGRRALATQAYGVANGSLNLPQTHRDTVMVEGTLAGVGLLTVEGVQAGCRS